MRESTIRLRIEETAEADIEIRDSGLDMRLNEPEGPVFGPILPRLQPLYHNLTSDSGLPQSAPGITQYCVLGTAYKLSQPCRCFCWPEAAGLALRS
jgi:hypothetical protein